MTWKGLTLASLLFAVASLIATLNGSSDLDRIAGSLSALPLVMLLCTAAIVRVLTERRNE